MIPLVDLTAQYHSIKKEIDAAVLSTLESGHFILGPTVSKFEESIASYLGVKHAIGLASGTDALVIAMRALNIGAGDEVIIPAYTFFATAGTVMSVGAKPVFVDVDPQSYQIDVSRIKAVITPRTKAIIPVHLYGHPSEMDPILEIAREHNLKVIEDNAQAFGAEYKGKKTGSLGEIGCLSFFPTKNLGAFGDGGGVVTDDDALAERMRMLRTHGWKKKYYSEEVGYNSRLDAMQAAILQAKLPHIDAWNDRRRELSHRYTEKLISSGLVTPVEREWGRHVYHLYIVRSSKRVELQSFLKDRGIASEVYYPLPPHLAVPCRHFGYKEGDFPHAEKAANETFALPLYPELTESQQDEVVAGVMEMTG
ncbi:MAG: DegT/DnrJ/EryC1/StrS family aminotransferase [Anaerolineales bacterium]|jgi:dTDP-4-amino-4,6-dideoxygalactose transaminase|nr:DegT/DnrJ/EryC1/StrS family aminotransferase [Anaerolineales bacterium]